MFKSLNTIPPGGWRFYDPKINWPTSPNELRGIGLEPVVDKVIEKRRANKGRFPELALDRATVRNEVLAYTEAAVRQMKGAESYLAEGPQPMAQPGPASFPVARSLRARVAEAAGTVKASIVGVGLLVDWLGDGMEAAAQDVAEGRAAVCATSGPEGSLCPHNRPATGLQRISSAAAEDIRQLMEAKKDMRLETSRDPMLHVCQICQCGLKLKVFAPMDVLLRKTSPELLARFQTEWPACWMNRA